MGSLFNLLDRNHLKFLVRKTQPPKVSVIYLPFITSRPPWYGKRSQYPAMIAIFVTPDYPLTIKVTQWRRSLAKICRGSFLSALMPLTCLSCLFLRLANGKGTLYWQGGTVLDLIKANLLHTWARSRTINCNFCTTPRLISKTVFTRLQCIVFGIHRKTGGLN